MEYNVTYNGDNYLVTTEPPKDGDQVLTDNYGVWEFKQAPCPIPYWGNANACKKIISINGNKCNENK